MKSSWKSIFVCQSSIVGVPGIRTKGGITQPLPLTVSIIVISSRLLEIAKYIRQVGSRVMIHLSRLIPILKCVLSILYKSVCKFDTFFGYFDIPEAILEYHHSGEHIFD